MLSRETQTTYRVRMQSKHEQFIYYVIAMRMRIYKRAQNTYRYSSQHIHSISISPTYPVTLRMSAIKIL